jgi:hypothetical protein
MPVTLPPSRIRILLDEPIHLKRIGREEGWSKKRAGEWRQVWETMPWRKRKDNLKRQQGDAWRKERRSQEHQGSSLL